MASTHDSIGEAVGFAMEHNARMAARLNEERAREDQGELMLTCTRPGCGWSMRVPGVWTRKQLESYAFQSGWKETEYGWECPRPVLKKGELMTITPNHFDEAAAFAVRASAKKTLDKAFAGLGETAPEPDPGPLEGAAIQLLETALGLLSEENEGWGHLDFQAFLNGRLDAFYARRSGE